MTFKLVHNNFEGQFATIADQDDAQYAANIFNSYRERTSRPAGSHAVAEECETGDWRVRVDGLNMTLYLQWEWFVIRRQATLPISPGKYRVSFNRCAPGFSLEDAQGTAARHGNSKGYAVTYEVYKGASDAAGHASSSDLEAPYVIEPWAYGY